MRTVFIMVGILVGSYTLLCFLVYLFQSRLVFFPDRVIVSTPSDIDLKHEEVLLQTEDGISLAGWFVPAAKTKTALLFCHGNAGNISHRLDSIRIFHELGLSVLAFDYRGYGKSQGHVSERGTYADASAAYRYLVEEQGFEPERILIFGRSLGGAVAIELATHHEARALIVESSFTSIAELGRRTYPYLPVGILARIRYDSRSRVGAIHCPKLFIHSREDKVIPYSLGRRLFEYAAEPKEFLEIRGGHADGFLASEPRYVAGVGAFLRSLGSLSEKQRAAPRSRDR